jgi:hypothetical protein
MVQIKAAIAKSNKTVTGMCALQRQREGSWAALYQQPRKEHQEDDEHEEQDESQPARYIPIRMIAPRAESRQHGDEADEEHHKHHDEVSLSWRGIACPGSTIRDDTWTRGSSADPRQWQGQRRR